MSVDGRTCAVMKGIRHGACDYLIKPVRLEELRNIWQHVVRKIYNENKEHANSGDAKHTSSIELEIDDPSSKKPRVVWSVDLHEKFVSAVIQLGLDSMTLHLFFLSISFDFAFYDYFGFQ